jgi:hypothetical protein
MEEEIASLMVADGLHVGDRMSVNVIGTVNENSISELHLALQCNGTVGGRQRECRVGWTFVVGQGVGAPIAINLITGVEIYAICVGGCVAPEIVEAVLDCLREARRQGTPITMNFWRQVFSCLKRKGFDIGWSALKCAVRCAMGGIEVPAEG